MRLVATRSDGAEAFYTRTEVREDFMGRSQEVEMGVIVMDGVTSPEKELMNLLKFNDWDFVEDN